MNGTEPDVTYGAVTIKIKQKRKAEMYSAEVSEMRPPRRSQKEVLEAEPNKMINSWHSIITWVLEIKGEIHFEMVIR